MKRVTAAVCLVLLSAVGITQQHVVNATEQVWSGEEAYWRYVQSHDLQHYMELWSDDFVGWPIVTDHPIHKRDIATQFQSGPLSRVVAYELQRESVEIHGPIGIAFYRVKTHRRNTDHSESTTTFRITHTWMKAGDVWQIVGGMSADDSVPTAANSESILSISELQTKDPEMAKRVVFDNEKLRVFKMTKAAHQMGAMHDAPGRLLIFVTDGHLRRTYPDKPAEDDVVQAGDLKWWSGGKHTSENVGDRDVTFLMIVPK